MSLLSAKPQGTVQIHQDKGLKIVCEAATPHNTPFVTRKKNTAATIFNGLANTAAHLANMIAGGSPQAKQYGALNVISTICNVTAQLSEKTQNPEQAQRNLGMGTFTYACTDLTNTLLATLEEEAVMRKPLPQTLLLLRNIPAESRGQVIDLMLASSTHAYQFINELFSLAYEYLTACSTTFFMVLDNQVDNLSEIIDAPQSMDTLNFAQA